MSLFSRFTLPAVLAAFLVIPTLFGCSGSSTPPDLGGACEFTYQCPTGSVCRDSVCVEASLIAADSGSTPAVPGDDGGGEVTPDAGEPLDGGGSTNDAGTVTERPDFAPARYRRCMDDLECAVFGGNCLTELTLSRPDAQGRDRVKVSDLDSSFAAGQGVCTLPCTNDPRICESITLSAPGGKSEPFSCQVVFAAASPYPSPAPAFPFDSQLDPVAMSRGVPFASVCRPPFQFSKAHAESFCAPCTEDAQCNEGKEEGSGDSACLLERASATPASGSCVEPCGENDSCAFGFTCGTVPGSTSGAKHCLPNAGTCGRCLDSDGDLRGVGKCGPLSEPNTGVDCDDTNPIAFYDGANMGHAFPAVCGNTDVNCNGLSDEAEQLGTEDHCASCGDVCVGRAGEIANSRRSCVARAGAYECVAACDPGYADCDGDVNNGCEQVLGPNMIYAEDVDSDLRGSMTAYRYVCDNNIPAGWVNNRLDCEDTNATIYGGSSTQPAAPELCDGLDNNCNGVTDDPGSIQGEGDACSSGHPGICSPGKRRCVQGSPDAGTSTGFVCEPNIEPSTVANAKESCDGLDNNCNGSTDENVDYYEDRGETNPRGSGSPAPCSIPGNKGICSQGTYSCTPATTTTADGGTIDSADWQCVPTPPESTDPIDSSGVDSNCDGTDGDLSNAVFVRPVAGGGTLDGNDANNGTSQKPVATINRALTLACAGGAPCKDIYVEAGEFSTTSAIVIPTFSSSSGSTPVRIYGGFATSLACTTTCQLEWTRGPQTSTFIREAGSRSANTAWPFGKSYAGIQAANTNTHPLRLVLDRVDVDVRAPAAGVFLQNGENAPSQIGFQCPDRGCAEVTFTDVSFSVENAIAGGDGTAARATGFGNLAGGDGCGKPDNCTGVGFAGDWMQYPESNVDWVWRNDALAGKSVAGCPDSARNNGGTSAAIRWQPSSGGNRQYRFWSANGGGWSGGSGGACWKEKDGAETFATATHGGDGSSGSGGRYSGTRAFRLSFEGGVWVPNWSVTPVSAGYGYSGSGGGGGGGCIYHGDYFHCPCGEYRGGGGGAGGCGGYGAQNGGMGGHAIGLVLVSGATLDMNLTLNGTFSAVVGNGGNGGKGGKGGDAAPGGYGGLSPTRHAYLNGGHGGDGGGGGGGAGGHGGTSLGVVRRCTRGAGTEANGCGINVPPVLLAAPGQYLSIGSAGAGGAKGIGGAPGRKTTDAHGRSDSSSAQAGADGVDGAAGTSASILFSK